MARRRSTPWVYFHAVLRTEVKLALVLVVLALAVIAYELLDVKQLVVGILVLSFGTLLLFSFGVGSGILLHDRLEELGERVQMLTKQLEDLTALLEGKLGNLTQSLESIEGLIQEAGAMGYESPPFKPATNTRSRLPTDVATDSEMLDAVAAGIGQTHATSLHHLGMVIKAARSKLKGKRFEERELQIIARKALENLQAG